MSIHKLDWFSNARFGMFVHYGAYAVAGRGEWVLNRENIPYDEYTAKYVEYFKAENYNPREWARLAKRTGMKYVVLTARHHDGFALWDTQTTDFNAVQLGPKKDLVKEFVEAIRAEGLKVGLYFSVADWHHADYPYAFCRDWPEGWSDEASKNRFFAHYTSQLKELMTQYGKIDMLWYDGCLPKPTEGREINEWIYAVQQDILINNRNGDPYDFVVCEQTIKPADPGIAWEACMTLNNNWGYHSGDHNYKSAKDVIRMLIQIASKRGNLLLNVGPLPSGDIPAQSVEILEQVGTWLATFGEGIYDTDRSELMWNNMSQLTIKDNRLFIYLHNDPGNEFCLAEISNRVEQAYYMDTGDTVSFEQIGNRIFLRDLKLDFNRNMIPCIVLELDGQASPVRKAEGFWIVD